MSNMQFVVYVNTLSEYLWGTSLNEVCTMFLLYSVRNIWKIKLNKIIVFDFNILISASCNMRNKHKSWDLSIKYSHTKAQPQTQRQSRTNFKLLHDIPLNDFLGIDPKPTDAFTAMTHLNYISIGYCFE